MKKNYSILNAGPFETLQEKEYNGFSGKLFVGKDLGLTGCEVSLNRLPAGTSMPFAHAHKKNEELYLVLRGSGIFFVDGEEFPVQEGSLVRIAPAGDRHLMPAPGERARHGVAARRRAAARGRVMLVQIEDAHAAAVTLRSSGGWRRSRGARSQDRA